MGTVIELFRNAAFDPEAVRILCAAFEQARQSLHEKGQPSLVQEVIARRIIAVAERGERDPDELCRQALASLGIDVSSAA
jgi:hypothetical protein